jgi:RNA polymerase sigma factor (sigma-70 family)
MNETLVVERVKQGEIEARNELSRSDYLKLHRYVLREALRRWPYLEPLSEDVTQETYLIGVEREGDFRGDSSLETWLRGIAKNLLRCAARRENGRVRGIGGDDNPVADVPDRLPAPIDILIGRERARLVTEAIEGLPGDLRGAVARLMDGESYHAVVVALAERQVVTMYAARKRLAGALESLGRRLSGVR